MNIKVNVMKEVEVYDNKNIVLDAELYMKGDLLCTAQLYNSGWSCNTNDYNCQLREENKLDYMSSFFSWI